MTAPTSGPTPGPSAPAPRRSSETGYAEAPAGGLALRDPVLEAVASVGRHWGWLLAYGIVTAALGVAILVWPDVTLLVVAVLFAVELFVAGVFRLVSAFTERGVTGGYRAFAAILGGLSVVLGLVLLRAPQRTLVLIALLIGIWLVVAGIADLVEGIGGGPQPGRAWRIVMGVVAVAAGIVVMVQPGISLTTLAVLVGIAFIVYGVLAAVAAVQLQRTLKAAGLLA